MNYLDLNWEDTDFIKNYFTTENVNKQDTKGRTPLFYAADIASPELIEYFLNLGADINFCSDKGDTPLIVACMIRCFDSVKFLLEKGANVRSTDHQGFSALYYAIKYNTKYDAEDIVRCLIDRGAQRDELYFMYPIRIHKIRNTPQWVFDIFESRENARKAVITFLGSSDRGDTMHIAKIIGKHIWSSRNLECWKLKSSSSNLSEK